MSSFTKRLRRATMAGLVAMMFVMVWCIMHYSFQPTRIFGWKYMQIPGLISLTAGFVYFLYITAVDRSRHIKEVREGGYDRLVQRQFSGGNAYAALKKYGPLACVRAFVPASVPIESAQEEGYRGVRGNVVFGRGGRYTPNGLLMGEIEVDLGESYGSLPKAQLILTGPNFPWKALLPGFLLNEGVGFECSGARVTLNCDEAHINTGQAIQVLLDVGSPSPKYVIESQLAAARELMCEYWTPELVANFESNFGRGNYGKLWDVLVAELNAWRDEWETRSLEVTLEIFELLGNNGWVWYSVGRSGKSLSEADALEVILDVLATRMVESGTRLGNTQGTFWLTPYGLFKMMREVKESLHRLTPSYGYLTASEASSHAERLQNESSGAAQKSKQCGELAECIKKHYTPESVPGVA